MEKINNEPAEEPDSDLYMSRESKLNARSGDGPLFVAEPSQVTSPTGTYGSAVSRTGFKHGRAASISGVPPSVKFNEMAIRPDQPPTKGSQRR